VGWRQYRSRYTKITIARKAQRSLCDAGYSDHKAPCTCLLLLAPIDSFVAPLKGHPIKEVACIVANTFTETLGFGSYDFASHNALYGSPTSFQPIDTSAGNRSP